MTREAAEVLVNNIQSCFTGDDSHLKPSMTRSKFLKKCKALDLRKGFAEAIADGIGLTDPPTSKHAGAR
jgi:hypothetical protein